MFNNFYATRRVFITGHTGFKGAWLTAWLFELGAELCGYSWDVPSRPALFPVLALEDKICHVQGDIRDLPMLKRTLEEFKPHIIFHLAAQALVRPSYENPILTIESNTLGTANLLEAARHVPGLETIICITSDKCYDNQEWLWGYRENDRLGGKDIYSASKACAELLSRAYFHSFLEKGPRLATARAGNVIGGGDWALDRIVPDCARAWAASKAVHVRHPEATRPWQHVLEPLSGYLWLGVQLTQEPDGEGALNGEAFNFGPSPEVQATVADVVAALGGYWPDFSATFEQTPQRMHAESTLLKLCCDKALQRLVWQAVLSFEETLRFTGEWYRHYYHSLRQNPLGADELMYQLTVGQIAGYAALAKKRGLAWV